MKKINTKEIGGYFELEKFVSHEYYPDFISFSSARNSLLYILKKRKINKIHMPYYLCDVVFDICKKNSVDIVYYFVDDNLMPVVDSCDDYIYIVNYFGIFKDKDIARLKRKYSHIIFDYTHCFFKKPELGIDTIYNCRKYFGVPDGAYLYTTLLKSDDLKIGISGHRFSHLIGRYENTASEFYNDFRLADLSFNDEDLCYMSSITHNLLGAIDYNRVRRIRKANFKYLHGFLKKYNLLNDRINSSMDFSYPLMINNAGELRNILIKNHIYVPVLWPNVINDCPSDSIEYHYASDIIFLPIDQRYSYSDMDIIINIIVNYFNSRKE